MKETKVIDSYNNELHTYIFDQIKRPKGVVQIVHGLNEHGLRYVEFAEFLNQSGYIVVVFDHLSQGKTRRADEQYVNFGKKGQLKLVDGLNSVRKFIQNEYPNLPIFAFGHSMGTMILRYYLQTQNNEYKKVILNGGGYSSIKGMNFAILIGRIICIFRPNKPSKFFDNLFRQTQFKIKEKTEIDHFIEWLTRDKVKSDLNKEDPYLFIRLTSRSFLVNLIMIKHINSIKNIINTHLDSPILLLSGSHDPATNFGEGTKELDALYKSNGNQSKYIIYEEGRHDTLQEINREEVFRDILHFLEE
jgi:alpha-beta hydrolase superfamily lysophospholipase